MFKWIQETIDQHKRQKNERQCLAIVQKLMATDWFVAKQHYLSPWAKVRDANHSFEKVFSSGEVIVTLRRYIRGDVVSVRMNGVEVMEYVDQSVQYKSQNFGPHNIKLSTTAKELKDAMK